MNVERRVDSFASCVGQFVLLAGLRIQTDESNRELFNGRSKERSAPHHFPLCFLKSMLIGLCIRSFADFMFGSLVLHFFVFNYRGSLTGHVPLLDGAHDDHCHSWLKQAFNAIRTFFVLFIRLSFLMLLLSRTRALPIAPASI